MGLGQTEGERVSRSRSLVKGAIAGLLGGIVATAAKNAVERIYPPQKRLDADSSTLQVREDGGRRHLSEEGLNWGLGAATGAAYGALAEFYPAATAKQGASFGMAFAAFTQDGALPALGLRPRQEYQTSREKTSDLASHIVYGVVTETVRRVVRRMID